MRLVLDANVLVSALLVGDRAGTGPRRLLRLCLEGQAVPLMGAALYAEYEIRGRARAGGPLRALAALDD